VARLILFNKPFGVLTQFRARPGEQTLADYIRLPGFYPAGRLDKDSEGLLLLTDDGALQHRISHPRHKLWKTYWVQVEGAPSPAALKALRAGVRLNDGPTLPAKVAALTPPDLWPRDPPIRYRANIPTAWIQVRIREGRNRQVRRMTAMVGLPTLRLIRVAIGSWRLAGLMPGDLAFVEAEPPTLAREDADRPRPTDAAT
jgi:23S rRNA pseudouridine2457 synthase